MNPLLAAALGSILRFFLAGLAGYMVERGIWDPSAADTYLVASVAAILSLGWSLWLKYRDRLKLLTALATPQAISEQHVEQLVRYGAAPPASAAKNVVPTLTSVLP